MTNPAFLALQEKHPAIAFRPNQLLLDFTKELEESIRKGTPFDEADRINRENFGPIVDEECRGMHDLDSFYPMYFLIFLYSIEAEALGYKERRKGEKMQ